MSTVKTMITVIIYVGIGSKILLIMHECIYLILSESEITLF